MSSQMDWNLDLVTLSTIALPLLAAYAILSRSGDSKKVKLPVHGHLEEVLAEGDLRKPKRPIVDVIAVHGLGSEYPRCWTKDDKMWLKDFLPDDLPLARILAFVYPSEAFNDPDLVDFQDLAGSLLRCIVNDRGGLHSESERDRPIIFIGHSFGGLLIKQALVFSQTQNAFAPGDHRYIANATCGILFFGTPHLGSNYASLGLLKAWVLSLRGQVHVSLYKTLQLLSPQLEHLNEDFLSIDVIRKLPQSSLACFYETKAMSMLFGRVVEEDSACLSVAMRVCMSTDHKGINKFSSREGPYNDVKWSLRKIYDSVVQSTLSRIHGNGYVYAVETCAPAFEISDRHPKESWNEALGFLCLSMGGSGTSGCIVLKDKTNEDKVAVTFGVHNWQPWVDLVTNFEETAQEIRDSYYGGKRDVWTACDGQDFKHRHLNRRSARVKFNVVPGSSLYLSKVTVD